MIRSIKLFVLLILVAACGNGEEGPVYNPTKYSLEAPVYFGDNSHFPEHNPLTVEGVALGRMLFYEKKLSRNNTISCATCHQQKHAFTDGLAKSPGIDGLLTARNTMSLVNLPWTSRFFWDGRAESLEIQSLEPIKDPIEMDQTLLETVIKLENTTEYPDAFFKAFGNKAISSERIAEALAQFQRTLISSNSKYDKYLSREVELTEQEQHGMELFFTHPEPSIGLRGGNCGDCHVNILTSGVNDDFEGFKNNGLDGDEDLEEGLEAVTGLVSDRGKFKVPSLRNIALTAPYMHDGRFATLEEVLDHYNDHIKKSETLDPLILEASNENIDPNADIKLGLTTEEKQAIIAFLHTLTDNEFISNEAFSDPF